MMYAEYKKAEIRKFKEDPKKGTPPYEFGSPHFTSVTIGKGAKSHAPRGFNRTW